LAAAISLTEHQLQVLQDHALRHAPNESCAILYGKTGGDGALVEGSILTGNADASPTSVAVSGEDIIGAYKKAEERGAEVVGIFHSHPDSEARPSATDEKFMEINPVVWIIYSGRDGDFGAFVFEDGIKDVRIA